MSPQPAKSGPERIDLVGHYVRLEPLDPRHAADLLAVSNMPGGPERFRWLFSEAPASGAEMDAWIDKSNAGPDRYVAVIDKASGKAVGQQAWLRIRPEHGSIEIGGVHWGLPMAKTPLATEALYLFARHAFDDLGYRRFEWKCNNLNEPSKAAARRFGFSCEGLFRQHMWVKGANRDTAWFAMLDHEWPRLKRAYGRWLDPANFDAASNQRSKLQVL